MNQNFDLPSTSISVEIPGLIFTPDLFHYSLRAVLFSPLLHFSPSLTLVALI